MSAPKLYLILISGGSIEKITTYRELEPIQHAWQSIQFSEKIGIIHCGFNRPSLSKNVDLPSSMLGKIIYSGSLRWSLPEFYESSNQPIIHIEFNNQLTPCYLALNQWGYELTDIDQKKEPASVQVTNIASLKDTISLAAQQVLADANRQPLNKEEIYARIVESNYYQFNTPTPVHVLDLTLNRETIDTNYSKASKDPVYGKTKEGRYYLLGSIEIKGWVLTLSNEEPELYEKLVEYGVSDDQSYLTIRDQLPTELSTDLDNKRFEFLKGLINPNDPTSVLQYSPLWVLELDISSLGFSVRVENALLSEDIYKVKELAALTMDYLKKIPNLGKKSIFDMGDAIIKKIGNTSITGFNSPEILPVSGSNIRESLFEVENIPLLNQIESTPLKEHLNRTLDGLSEVDRIVLHGRLGYKGKVLTLEEIGDKLDVTRERIRQRQNKYIKKIITTEHWDDVIGIRIGQLLLDRDEPLILEMLEIEDPWFEGFMNDSYIYLGNVIQMFSENAIQVIKAQGRNVVTRITQKKWDKLFSEIKNILKQKADQKIWSHSDVNQYFESYLAEHSARELAPLLLEAIGEFLQFDGNSMDATLIAYGKTAESAISAVLAQADRPLHFTEIAKRATELLGKTVDERRAHNAAAAAKEVWLFDRGTYGLIEHCPVPESKRKSIRHIVEHMLYQEPINKQWHSKEIIEQLNKKFPAIPEELNPYVLRMCIDESEKINFLNRMVWARADSGLSSDERIDTSEAFIQILEEAGEPLSGKELKNRLSEIRGVDANMQIHANERLISVSPNVWGLSEWLE